MIQAIPKILCKHGLSLPGLYTQIVCIAAMLVATPCAAEATIGNAFPNLFFSSPVDLQYAPDGSNRLFVVEQAGRIRVFDNHTEVAESNIFLDIRERVNFGGERGLLGLAFHPDFAGNGYFYVNYILSGGNDKTIVARYSVSSENPNLADESSELVLLSIDQPFSNHNGGQLVFGPDGYLYIATGDGGSGGDPQGNGQNLQALLGKILRIDVNTATGENNYGIPPENPFALTPFARPEIYAYGLRNPWRMSFDRSSGQLWAGDVGQGDWEEIDLIEPGGNYGWNTMEGFHCFSPPNGCNTGNLVLPVWEYAHQGGNNSISGGYVYRGSAIPQLAGNYIYADFVSGRIWALDVHDLSSVSNVELIDSDLNISSFGEDAAGELYIVDHGGGIYRFLSVDINDCGIETPGSYVLEQNYPNPFNSGTEIPFIVSNRVSIRISVYDVSGKYVSTITDQIYDPGRQRAFWNGRDRLGNVLASGIYIYALFAESQPIDARRMIILK